MQHIFTNISGSHEFIIERDSSCTIYIFIDKQTELSIKVMPQEGSFADVRIVHIQKQDSHVVLHTTQHHEAANASSKVLVVGALYDTARFNYTGNIYVGTHAENSVAEQKSHTLLLSPTAHAQATPALEVLTKNVQCKHGSAIAGFNKATLEYLTSRGLTRETAEQLLVDSFFLAALDDPSAQQLFRSLAENNPLR